MLEFLSHRTRTCAGVSRRSALTVGSLGMLGWSLAESLAAREARAAVPSREPACIFVWLDGGPSQFETFDPKPEAPVEIRGPYGAIPTNVSGIRISELLPSLAQRMDRFTILRSFTHTRDAHSPLHVLNGVPTSPASFGAVVSYLRGRKGNLPPYVRLGSDIRGIGGGRLGAAHDPVQVREPGKGSVVLPDFDPPAAVTPPRFRRRRSLLEEIEHVRRATDQDAALEGRDAAYRRAWSLLTSTEVRSAFDLKQEPAPLRARYGANKFGQSCLLARRLIEAGTRFVEIKWFGDVDSSAYDSWDTHGADLPGLARLEHQLCPRLDMGFSALLDDLHDRGLLQSTLIVALGEFGRTPRINLLGGRDHWPAAQSVFMAGAGVPPGVVGSTDEQGAYPASRPVSLENFVTTFYRLLDLNPNVDDRLRPFAPTGQVVEELAPHV